VNDDGGILKTTLRLGTIESGRPPVPSLAKIRYAGTVLPSAQRFEAGVSEVMLGEQHVSRGLEKGVLCMHKGETAELLLRADYAYGDAGRPPLVPPGASVRYEVELISWRVPKKDRSELSDDEVLAEATRLKACGTRAFGDNSWQEAQHFYHDGAHLLLNDFEELRAPEGRELEARALLTSCWLNEAMCALRREEWFAAENICTQVLRRLADPLGREREQNVKALFRRGKALMAMSEFERARVDLREAAKLEPSNREVREAWEQLRARESSQRGSQDAVLGKMTTKLLYREVNIGRKKRSANPHVWMEVQIGASVAGRIIFELFADRVPKTAENFRALCTGEKGISYKSGKRLHYKGSCFHRAVNIDDGPVELLNESADGTGRNFEIWKGMFVQGGDIINNDGSGGESIYGEVFDDESSDLRHAGPGWVSMAGTAPMREKEAEERVHRPNRNHSQFMITTMSRNGAQGGQNIMHFDGRHVVFARVVKGMDVVHRINKLPVIAAHRHKLTQPVIISDCGEVKDEPDDEAAKAQAGATGAPAPDTRSSLQQLAAQAEAPLLQEAEPNEAAAAEVQPLSEEERDGVASAEVDED